MFCQFHCFSHICWKKQKTRPNPQNLPWTSLCSCTISDRYSSHFSWRVCCWGRHKTWKTGLSTFHLKSVEQLWATSQAAINGETVHSSGRQPPLADSWGLSQGVFNKIQLNDSVYKYVLGGLRWHGVAFKDRLAVCAGQVWKVWAVSRQIDKVKLWSFVLQLDILWPAIILLLTAESSSCWFSHNRQWTFLKALTNDSGFKPEKPHGSGCSSVRSSHWALDSLPFCDPGRLRCSLSAR